MAEAGLGPCLWWDGEEEGVMEEEQMFAGDHVIWRLETGCIEMEFCCWSHLVLVGTSTHTFMMYMIRSS